jgi:3-dehydroquinate dehydratase-2
MTKVLVIQGAGMNMRGKAQIEVFGTTTLDQINEQVRGFAEGLGLDLEIFHSNIEGEVVNALYAAHDGDIDAALINPAGYTTGMGPLRAAIAQVRFPVYEVHASNPTARGTVSAVQPVCKGSVYGFGVYGYYLALEAIKHQSKG